MSEPLPQPEDPEIKCISFQLIDEKVNNYVLTANDSGVGTWQPGGSGPTENVDCKSFRLSTNPAAGYILTSDAVGNGTWEPPTSSPNIVCNSFALNQSPYNGYVLMSNASGVGTWQDPYSTNARKISTVIKTNKTSVPSNINFVVDWTNISSPGLNLILDKGGKQIVNDSPADLIFLFNTTLHWSNNISSFINIWINVQPRTDDPNNPSQIGYYFYGQHLYNITGATGSLSISTSAIIKLPAYHAINVVIYTPNSTDIGLSDTYGVSYCNLILLE